MRLLTYAAAIALAPAIHAMPAAAQTETAQEDPAMSGELTFERVFASPGLDGPSPRGAKH